MERGLERRRIFASNEDKQDDLEIEARTRPMQAGWDLTGLIDVVCTHFEIDVEQITDKEEVIHYRQRNQ